MKKILILAALAMSTGLAGCTGWVDDEGNPLSVQDLNAALSDFNSGMQQQARQHTQQMQAQTQTYIPPVVETIKQPDGTSIVYCRALTGVVYACRQIR